MITTIAKKLESLFPKSQDFSAIVSAILHWDMSDEPEQQKTTAKAIPAK
jgi:hypothetical protein